LDLKTDPAGKPLRPVFGKAFEYSDGWVDDARMVVLNARDAASKGAMIMSRAKVVSARREGGLWQIEVRDEASGTTASHKARMLVNAGGPWVDQVLSNAVGRNNVHNVRLVQGSHIIVRKKFEDRRAYFFQNPDNRIFFAIPYETDYTLIGTTDRDFPGDPKDVRISPEEIDYLCSAASEYFSEPVTSDDIVWTYSAVRPLYDDGASKAQEATRDYVLKVDEADGAPLLNVFGGKLTTYRRLSEHALEKIGETIGEKGGPWTARSHLPGGDFPVAGAIEEERKLMAAYPFISQRQASRLIKCYGTDAKAILGEARSIEGLGRHFGGTLYEAEVRWSIEKEWARTAEDVLWRRTKQGLFLTAEEAQGLEEYMAGVRRAA
jgi:glycerol-3-phosphate dehydrogenase